MASDAVRRSLDPRANVFCALDLTAWYHEVELSEEDKDLTCFTLPWGRFRYEVLPMGLKPSSDIFNIQSDRALQGVEGALKSVNDVLTQAGSYKELKERLVKRFL